MAVFLDYSNAIVLEPEVAAEKNISHGKLEKKYFEAFGKNVNNLKDEKKCMELPVVACWKHKIHMH